MSTNLNIVSRYSESILSLIGHVWIISICQITINIINCVQESASLIFKQGAVKKKCLFVYTHFFVAPCLVIIDNDNDISVNTLKFKANMNYIILMGRF